MFIRVEHTRSRVCKSERDGEISKVKSRSQVTRRDSALPRGWPNSVPRLAQCLDSTRCSVCAAAEQRRDVRDSSLSLSHRGIPKNRTIFLS